MAEEIHHHIYPLHQALQLLGSPSVISHSRNRRIIISKFPKEKLIEHVSEGNERHWKSFQDEQVTGLCGISTVNAKGAHHVTIKNGEYWEIRWDYDSKKGSHVNVKAGGRRFAILYPEGSILRDIRTAPNPYFDAMRNQTSLVEYKKGMDDKHLAHCADALAKYYCSRF